MKLPRLTLLALVAPSLALLPTAGPAVAVRADSPAAAYAVDEWDDGDLSQLPDEPYRRVEVTYDATYGIALDGTVHTSLPSWKNQALVAPGFDRPIVDVTGGTYFGMALDDLGHVRTWGEAPAIPTEDLATSFRDVAAIGEAAIGVTTDGELRLWGAAASQYAFDPAAVADADIVSIDVDSSAAVALTDDGHLLYAGGAITGEWNAAWGFPAEHAEDTFVAAEAGYEFAVALTDDGEIVAWGVDHEVISDETGMPTGEHTGETTVPELPAGRHPVAVSAGYRMAAAVLDDGSVLRWGRGERTVIPAARPDLPVVDVDLDRYRSAVTYAVLASTAAPAISDTTPTFGDTLTATPGTWTDEPDAVHYEWRAHDRNGGSAVVGTDSPTYSPTAKDAFDWVTLSVTVTATKDGFVSGTATSAQTDNVAQLQFTAGPTLDVTGEPRVGQTLTATATGTSPVPDDEMWMWFTVVRGADPESLEDDDLTPIPGATSDTLTITPELAGKAVFANLTVLKEGYEPAFDETEDVVVQPGTLVAPKVTVTGKPRVGQTLTATVADDPAATGTSYQWLRGSAPIAGATARTYKPVAADLGKRLAVRVTTTATGYGAASATSGPTAAVTLGAARLKVAVPAKAKVGSKATIKVTGLASGERFTVTVAGTKVVGKATGAGVGTVRVPVTGKPGSRPVTVVGSLVDRKGSATLRVVKG